MSLFAGDQPFQDEDEDQKRKAEIEDMMSSQRESFSATSRCSRNTGTLSPGSLTRGIAAPCDRQLPGAGTV